MTAAIGLRRRGIDTEIVEIDPTWSPAGVGLLLQSPPLRALRTIGLLDRCIESGYVHPEVRFCDADGFVRALVHPPAIPGENLPSVAISRPALHDLLAAAVHEAGASVRLGLTVDELEQHDADVRVRFSDGTDGSYDLVVGADGVASRVRELAFPDAPPPTPVGQTIWRTAARRPEELTYYPIFHKRGAKVGLVPISEEEIYVYCLQNGGESRPPHERLAGGMRDALAGYNALVDAVREQIVDPATVDYRGLWALIVPPPWHRGRVLLIGDAAHTTTPHLAFGVGIAIEDGIVLAELAASNLSLQAMLEQFTARRFERCRLIVENSLRLCDWEQHPDTPGADPVGVARDTFAVMAEPI